MRTHGRILISIWRDTDFIALDAASQRLYLLLLSQKDVNNAGVQPLMISKWAKGCCETSSDDILRTLHDLQAARFVCFDEDTEELLIRSFIRNDGILKQPNVFKNALRVAEQTESPRLRTVLADELDSTRRADAAETAAKIRPPEPFANPFETLPEPFPKGSEKPRSPEPFANPSERVSKPCGVGEGVGEVVTTSSRSRKFSRDNAEIGRVDINQLVNTLAAALNERGVRRPASLTQWHRQAKQILDDDQRPIDEALAVLAWSQNDEFWSKNILTMGKFREKYDQLRLAGNIRPAIDPEALLRECWDTGRLGKVSELTGWTPPIFRHPEDPAVDRDTAFRDHIRKAIEDNREELLMRLNEVK